MDKFPSTVATTLAALFKHYSSHVPTADQLKYEADVVVNWHVDRLGMASCLAQVAQLSKIDSAALIAVFKFLLEEALMDDNSEVLERLVNAGVAILTVHGKDNVTTLLPLLQAALD